MRESSLGHQPGSNEVPTYAEIDAAYKEHMRKLIEEIEYNALNNLRTESSSSTPSDTIILAIDRTKGQADEEARHPKRSITIMNTHRLDPHFTNRQMSGTRQNVKPSELGNLLGRVGFHRDTRVGIGLVEGLDTQRNWDNMPYFNELARKDAGGTQLQEKVFSTETPGLEIVFARVPLESETIGRQGSYEKSGSVHNVIALRFTPEFKGFSSA